jgi:hypothetical protein
MKNTLKLAVLGCSALALTISSAANAFTLGTADIDDPVPTGASAATEVLMQAACTAKAAAHGSNWSGTLDASSIDDGTYNSGSAASAGAQISKDNFQGIGNPIPTQVVVATNPFRNGGSVNMFGMAHVVAAHYADSTYDFQQSFTWSSTYTFTCDMAILIPTGYHHWTGPV